MNAADESPRSAGPDPEADPGVTGTVVDVRGSVVDIRFENHLPSIYALLHARDGTIAIEVLAQIDAHQVRGIALTPTQGLSRGDLVEDSGGPLKLRGAPYTGHLPPWLAAPLNPRFSKPVSRSSTCSCRWNGAARRDFSAERAWAKRFCSQR